MRSYKTHANQYLRPDPRGLYLLIAYMAIGAYLNYRFQEPFNPFVAHSYAVPKIQASETATQPRSTIDDLVDGIHFLETGRGKAKIGLQGICAAKGMSNEYGWGGMKLKICFPTHADAKARVTKRVIDLYNKYTGDEGSVLCMYNLGKEVKNCEYYQNYLKMRNNEIIK